MRSEYPADEPRPLRRRQRLLAERQPDQFISDCGGKNVLEAIQKSIDSGACACYIQGGVADDTLKAGNFDLIAKGVELIPKNGLHAGISGHKLSTIQASRDRGLRGDFWMKTLHKTNYWSAAPKTECDNIWCDDPTATAAYMRGLAEPWIAFKVLAAGAIHPKDSFRFAFESGADFICVGVYDFPIVEDVNLALDVVKGPIVRQREWRAYPHHRVSRPLRRFVSTPRSPANDQM